MKQKCIILFTFLFVFLSNIAAEEIFIEAESFENKGGWKVDPQFVEIMGSPYLLAHGLGESVENASTSFNVGEAGNYTLWVRTKDWCPGNWEAPGRFQVVVNGETDTIVFGDTLKDWGWRKGSVHNLEAGINNIELIDLTGFDGRVDSVLFADNPDFIPPSDSKELKFFRKKIAGYKLADVELKEYDCVVVGGGIAGCGAAYAAASKGLKVALIHDRPVLGGNASEEVRVHTEGIHGKSAKILKMLDTVWWPNGSSKAKADSEKRTEFMQAVDGIDLFLCWRAFETKSGQNQVEEVYAKHIETGKELRFKAPVFIDCTGDGWIGYWSGAEYRYGRESRNEFGEGISAHGDLWSPEKPDNRVMGSSLLWQSVKTKKSVKFPEVKWALPVSGKMKALNGEWYWEFGDENLHQIDDAEQIRDHILRAIYGSFANAKKSILNRKYKLDFVGYILGKRESRRLIGDHIFSYKDAKSNRYFPDTVAEETREVDVHYQVKLNPEHQYSRYDFISEALFSKVGMYYIPFRSLYSRNISNLMMAGRCFSCSHVGLGGPRVMNTTGQMGIATGYAAYLCVKYDATPREVYEKHIDELRELIGY
jgi:hypothetical protein